MSNFTLKREQTGLLVVDVQEKLLPLVERSCEVALEMQRVIKGFQILQLPIVVTEQYPKGLGCTVPALKNCLGPAQEYWSKTTFSALGDPTIRERLLQMPVKQWVIMGLEAHVCVLQTVKDLLKLQKEVVVLNDAIASRSVYDFSTGIAEMRDCGARISSTEIVFFELLGSSQAAGFKEISGLIKSGAPRCGCC